MVTKKFSKYQEELIHVCCNSNLPIVVVGKVLSGKDEIIPLIKDLGFNKGFLKLTQFDSYNQGSTVLTDTLKGKITSLRNKGCPLENMVIITNALFPDLSSILGKFIKIDFFSQEDSDTVNLRITDVNIDLHKETINLSDDVKNCLIYDETNRQFKFNNKGHSVTQTKSFIDVTNNNSYINDLSNLVRFIDTDYKLFDTIKCVGNHTTFEYNSLVIIDLRGLTIEPEKQEGQINNLILLAEELERKIVVITDNNKLHYRLDTRRFHSRYTYTKTE